MTRGQESPLQTVWDCTKKATGCHRLSPQNWLKWVSLARGRPSSDTAPEVGHSCLVSGHPKNVSSHPPDSWWQQWSHWWKTRSGWRIKQPSARAPGGSKEVADHYRIWSPKFDWVSSWATRSNCTYFEGEFRAADLLLSFQPTVFCVGRMQASLRETEKPGL